MPGCTPCHETTDEFQPRFRRRHPHGAPRIRARLPGKPLRLIAGEPMIVHVVRRAREARASEVVVATDDARSAEALAPLDVAVCMTSAAHTWARIALRSVQP